MELEKICNWKELVERHKTKEYYTPKGPFFICAYNCDGQNKSCGGYYEKRNKDQNKKAD